MGSGRLIYRPSVGGRLSVVTLKLNSDKISDVRLKTFYGEILNGWFLQGTAALVLPRKLIICFAGNSMNRLKRLADLREMASGGFGLLIFDYGGFGDSTGSPSESVLTNDAREMRQFVFDGLRYAEHDISVLGQSLGGAVALSLWSDDCSMAPRPRALLLSATFASMPRTVPSIFSMVSIPVPGA